MNTLYVKCLLYSYTHIKDLAEQIDDLVERKALAAMQDVSPCLVQCESILALTERKKTILKVGVVLDKIFKTFSDEEMYCIEYKYFRKVNSLRNVMINIYSRSYYRKQHQVIRKLSARLSRAGFTDKVFERDYLSLDFFREMLRRVTERELVLNKKNSFITGSIKYGRGIEGLRRLQDCRFKKNEEKVTRTLDNDIV